MKVCSVSNSFTAHTLTHIHVNTLTNTHTQTHAHKPTYTHSHKHTHKQQTCIHIGTHIHTQTHTHTNLHTHIHTHTHICTSKDIHVHAPLLCPCSASSSQPRHAALQAVVRCITKPPTANNKVPNVANACTNRFQVIPMKHRIHSLHSD